MLVAYLADFGLGKFSPAAASSGRVGDLTATMGGGTVPYMAPEQIRGSPATQRTDIFSLGCVMFEVYTGHRPYSFAERPLVPQIGTAAEIRYGSRLSPLVGQCMALNAMSRIGTVTLMNTVQEYLETRYPKNVARGIWSYLAEGEGRSNSGAVG